MFYLFDICLGFCGLLVCAVYAYKKHAHSGTRLFHQLLGVGWVVKTYTVPIWVEAIGNILYLSSTLRCYLCLGVGMCWGTGFCPLLVCAVYAYIQHAHFVWWDGTDGTDGTGRDGRKSKVSFKILHTLWVYRVSIYLLIHEIKIVTNIVMGFKIWCQVGGGGQKFQIYSRYVIIFFRF